VGGEQNLAVNVSLLLIEGSIADAHGTGLAKTG
jgi:hypothetical protein